jgi:hypothetical protein
MAALALPAFRPATALTDNQFESRSEFPVASLAALTKPKERAFVVSSRGNTYRIVVTTEPIPAWVEPTISAFIAVQTLPDNWDSYRGKKINRDLMNQSLSVLGSIMGATSPAPSVVPLGDGGLQLEWHRNQQDLEVVFAAEDAPRFFYQNRATGVGQEGFASDFMNLVQLLRGIA